MKYDNKSITIAGAELLSTDIANKQATVIEQMIVSDKQPSDLSNISHLTLDDFADALYYPVPIIHHQTNTFQPSGLITNNNVVVNDSNKALLSNIETYNGQQVGFLSKDYEIQMVGLVGHTENQTDNTLVAVAIANQGEAFTIPASTDIPYQLFFDIAVGYSNASNVIVNVNNAGYISQADLLNALQAYVTINTNQVITGDKNFTGKLQHNGVDVADVDQVNEAINENKNDVIDNHDGTAQVNGNTVSLAKTQNGIDWNTVYDGGFYSGINTVNGPYGNATTNVVVITGNGSVGNDVTQLATSPGNSPMYRQHQFATWGVWTQFASMNDIDNAYQNAVNTAKGNAVQDNHDGTITINGVVQPVFKEIDKNADLFAIKTAGTYISRWGFQDTLKNFPSADGSATIIYTGTGSTDNGIKITVIDSWGNEYVTNWASDHYLPWHKPDILDMPMYVINKGDSYDNYAGRYVHLDIDGINISTDVGASNGLPNQQVWGEFISIPNHNATTQIINDTLGNSWRRIAGRNWSQVITISGNNAINTGAIPSWVPTNATVLTEGNDLLTYGVVNGNSGNSYDGSTAYYYKPAGVNVRNSPLDPAIPFVMYIHQAPVQANSSNGISVIKYYDTVNNMYRYYARIIDRVSGYNGEEITDINLTCTSWNQPNDKNIEY